MAKSDTIVAMAMSYSLEERRDGDDDHFVVSHHAVHVLDHVSQIVTVRSENVASFIIIT